MPKLFIAKFKRAKGRYLVQSDSDYAVCGYEGQKILNKKQEKYGNKPDPQTGLYLDEMWRSFGCDEVTSIKPFKKSRSK